MFPLVSIRPWVDALVRARAGEPFNKAIKLKFNEGNPIIPRSETEGFQKVGANPIEGITTGRVRRTRRMIGNKPLEREKKEEWKRALGELCVVTFSNLLHGKMKIGESECPSFLPPICFS